MSKIKFLFKNPYFILFLINIIFFLPLFFPQLRVIITPEYGGGDENIFHYPIKYLFQKKIKNGQFLFWSNTIGGGYPIYAQGETGFFDPINLFTLFLFPFFFAINLQIFIYFLIILWGSYHLARRLKFSLSLSLFFAITFGYSFFNLANIIHLSHLSSFSYIPFIFSYFLYLIHEKPKKILNYLGLIFLFSLQFLSGHPQYFFYSLLLVFLYLSINYLFFKKQRKEILINLYILIILVITSLALVSFQLLPTIKYYQYTTRKIIENNFIDKTSLGFKDLFTFVSPFVNYNYNLILKNKDNLLIPPWDSNFFLGISSVIIFYFFIFKIKNISHFLFKYKIFIVLLIIILLLAFGQNSPLYFLGGLFPFSVFRVPHRLTYLINLILTFFTCLVIKEIFEKRTRLIVYSLIIVQFFISFILFYHFHVFTTPKKFFSENNLISFLKKHPQKKYFSLFFYEEYLPYLLYKKGIKREEKSYLDYLRFSLPQNFGLFYGLSNINFPTSATNFNRHLYLYRLILNPNENYFDRLESKTASLSAEAGNFFSLLKIDYLISPYQLKNIEKVYTLSKTFQVNDDFKVFLYQLRNEQKLVGPFIFSTQLRSIKTLDQFQNYLNQGLSDIVYLEEDAFTQNHKRSLHQDDRIKILVGNDDYFKVLVNNSGDGFLVFLNNYYPDWQAFVNGKKTNVHRANFFYQGIYLKKGKNVVEFKFVPFEFYLGLKISVFTFVILLIIVFLVKSPPLV